MPKASAKVSSINVFSSSTRAYTNDNPNWQPDGVSAGGHEGA
jgi:hypothetical protein